MFCEHAFDYEAEDLVRDALGRVLCPDCVSICEECRRKWFVHGLNEQGVCPDCEEALSHAGRESVA